MIPEVFAYLFSVIALLFCCFFILRSSTLQWFILVTLLAVCGARNTTNYSHPENKPIYNITSNFSMASLCAFIWPSTKTIKPLPCPYFVPS